MAIRPPTVLVGTARLRLTLTQAHEACDIDRLLVPYGAVVAAIAAAFGRAASQYEQHASCSKYSADALLTLLTGRQFASVLTQAAAPDVVVTGESGERSDRPRSFAMAATGARSSAAHHYLLADIADSP